MAELSGYKITLPKKRRETLALVVQDLYLQGGDTAKAAFWSGLRPTTPDSLLLLLLGDQIQKSLLQHGPWRLGLGHVTWFRPHYRRFGGGHFPKICTDDLGLSRYT
ncbi:hypothetical protein C7N83_03485 [Neisseria iguanae]|uniref:Uncharacterized protein n=2 Tax=Neisseria iguanae TaxID=90242 RepID=A0A2P7U1P4_9NEIS|nr:hypothetical protein C7N83_03485 [Neisseria iguanae]